MIKVLEIKTSKLSNLDFADNTIMFFFLFLNYWIIFLIPVAFAQVFNSIAKFESPIGIPTKKQKEKLKIIQWM